MGGTMSQSSVGIERVLRAAGELAREGGAFDAAEVSGGVLTCHAAGTPEDVWFRIEFDDGVLWVSWVTPNRYISQSIEADLMWTGDDLDDMIDEELVDQGWTGGSLGPMEHFRNDERLYTFRSRVPMDTAQLGGDGAALWLVQCLRAYSEAFGELGDMKPDPDEE